MAREGAPDGLCLRAERQTGGRGRMGRSWDSRPGNLALSILVRLHPGDPPVSGLALVAAVAAIEAARAFLGHAPAVHLKWPNDLMAGDAKLCGILLEREGDAVIAGFGMNITHAPDLPDRTATCLHGLGAGETVDAAVVADALAHRFAAWLYTWRSEGLAPVRSAWLAAAHPAGTSLRVSLPDGGLLSGAFDGLAADGALILGLEDGTKHAIHAGDIFELAGGRNHAARD